MEREISGEKYCKLLLSMSDWFLRILLRDACMCPVYLGRVISSSILQGLLLLTLFMLPDYRIVKLKAVKEKTSDQLQACKDYF